MKPLILTLAITSALASHTAPSIPKYDRADYPYTVTSYYTQQRISTPKRPTDCIQQTDHIVSLHDAHNSGAYKFTAEQKRQFASDPLNLVIACQSVNSTKSDRLPYNQNSPHYKGFIPYTKTEHHNHTVPNM